MSKVTDEFSELNIFKDKTISDINNYKVKLENYTSKIKLNIENGEKGSKVYTDKLIKKIEIKMKDLFEEYNNRLNEIKFQNIALSENIKKISEDLLTQVNNVKMVKNEIYNKFEEYAKIIKKENSKVLKSLEGYKEEFYNIKKKYKEISNHIKYKGDLKNINFELKSAYNKNRKSIKPYNRVDAMNILKINKIEFAQDFDDIKRKLDKRMSLRATVNFSTKRKDRIGSLSLQNNKNNPLNSFFDQNNNKNNITKSVIKLFKPINNSNYSSNSNNNSIIKEEDNKNDLYSKREKSTQSDNNKSIIKEIKLTKNIMTNENKKDDIKEENKQKTFYKLDNNNKKDNKNIINNIIINKENNQNKKEDLNNNHNNDYKNYFNKQMKNKNIVMPSELFNYNKVAISLDDANNFDYYSKSKENEKDIKKDIIKNVKNIIKKDKLRNKSNNGYPKIVTNNGERIIISTRPINNKKKFVTYTNPNVLALNNCVQKLFGNKTIRKIPTKSKSIKEEKGFDLFGSQIENNIYNLKKGLYDESLNISKPNKLLLSQQSNSNI